MSLSSKAHIIYLNQAGIAQAISELKYLGSVPDDLARDNLTGLSIGNVVSVTNSAEANNSSALYHYNGNGWTQVASEFIVDSVLNILSDWYSASEIDVLLDSLGIYPPVSNLTVLNNLPSPSEGFICTVLDDSGKQSIYQFINNSWNKLIDEDLFTTVTQILSDISILEGVSEETKFWKSPVANLTELNNLPSPIVGEIRVVLSGVNNQPTLYRYTTQWDVFNQIPSVDLESDLLTYTLLPGSKNQVVLVLETESLWFYLQGTGWKEIGGTSGGTYTNSTPTVEKVGGIDAGSTFLNKTMKEMWDALLYPYIKPFIENYDITAVAQEVQSDERYLVDGSSISNVNFSFTVVPKSNEVTTIEYYIAGILFETDTVNYTITTSVTKDIALTFTGVKTSLPCKVRVYDNIGGFVESTLELNFAPKLYFFVTNTDFIDPSISQQNVGNVLINSLNSDNYDFQYNRLREEDVFNPSNQYIYYVWESIYGNDIPPVRFTINGLTNTAWINRIITYTNEVGFIITKVVFRSEYKLNNTFNIKVR